MKELIALIETMQDPQEIKKALRAYLDRCEEETMYFLERYINGIGDDEFWNEIDFNNGCGYKSVEAAKEAISSVADPDAISNRYRVQKAIETWHYETVYETEVQL